MKKIIYSIILSSFLYGCSSDYLNVDTTEYLTADKKKELIRTSPETISRLVRADLNGVYNVLIQFDLNENTAHDYFGLKSIHLATDLSGQDVIQDVHHWFGFDYDMENREAPYRRTRLMWALFYKVISSVNITLSEYYSEPVQDAQLLQMQAELRSLRGIAYYYLVNLYQKSYAGNEKALGVPILLHPEDSKKPRALVEDVYKQIVSDFRFGVEFGSATATNTDVDKLVSASFLAKAYAHKNQWDSVAFYANIATQNASLAYNESFANIGNADWLWGYDITGQTTTRFASFYSHADNTIPGYASVGVTKSIFNGLYDLIPTTDIRKKQFVNADLFPDLGAEYKLKKYVGLKYVTPSDFTGDYCFLRVVDPYLLLVEAYVELNKLDEAKALLDNFVKTRNANYSAALLLTQEALREEVRLQRRIELWSEGSAFFDFKRWNIGVMRNVPNSNHRTKIDVPAGDLRFVYKIPQTELDANSEIVQNP
jgi:SusD family.